jgi:hypothetical protein
MRLAQKRSRLQLSSDAGRRLEIVALSERYRQINHAVEGAGTGTLTVADMCAGLPMCMALVQILDAIALARARAFAWPCPVDSATSTVINFGPVMNAQAQSASPSGG